MVMDITSIIFGFILGIIFIILCFILSLYLSNKRFLHQCITANNVQNETLRKIISQKQKQIIKSPKIGITNNFNNMQTVTLELIKEIATYYYPNSKYPHLEINILDAILMNERVLNRLKPILDMKIISMIKNVRIAQIIRILETKKTIESHKLFQFSKKYQLNKILSYGYMALNFANPGYWLRKFIYTSTLETTLRSIAVMTLNIVGEEATQLYSKKIIDNSDKILEKELTKFIQEIEAS